MMKIRVQKVINKCKVREKRQQVLTSSWRSWWHWEPVHSWGRLTRLYSCCLICKVSVAWMPKPLGNSMGFKADRVHCCEEGDYGRAGKRKSPRKEGEAFGEEPCRHGSSSSHVRTIAWMLALSLTFEAVQVCRLPLRISHSSFILPNAPCTFHCYQPFFSTPASFYPQSRSHDSPPGWLTVSVASFASAQRTEKHHKLTFKLQSSRGYDLSSLLLPQPAINCT